MTDLVKWLRGEANKMAMRWPDEAADRIDGLEASLAVAEAGEDALAEALRERDGGVHDEDCRSHRLNMGMFAQSCNCGHEDALAALAAYEARRKG